MGSSLAGSRVDRLPSRFPIGTRFVIEGRSGGARGVRIVLRRLEFPDGRRVDLPVEKAVRAAPRRRRLTGRTGARK